MLAENKEDSRDGAASGDSPNIASDGGIVIQERKDNKDKG